MSPRRTLRHGPPAVWLLAEISLIAVTLAAVAGFDRLFIDRTWVNPIVITAIVAHVSLAVPRRLGAGVPQSTLLSLVATGFTVTWLNHWETTTSAMPTQATLDQLDIELSEAWNLFQEVLPPAPVAPGFVVGASIAIWFFVWVADLAAFRARSTVQALAPATVLFVFIVALSDDTNEIRYAALFIAAAMLFAVAHRALLRVRSSRWLAGTSSAAGWALMRNGAAIAAVGLLATVALGPAVPGADDPPLVDLDETVRENGPRVVISPLVDIRKRLVDLPDVEVFTVRSDERSYWRLTSLDAFDGQVWASRADYSSAGGDLESAVESGSARDTAQQRFRVTGLGAVWLPAAFEPVEISEIQGADVSYEPSSSTLIVDSSNPSSDGVTYLLTSELPRFDPGALATAGTEIPPEIRERYTALPADLNPRVASLASEITADSGTVYDAALALQNWFRSEFTYDLDIGAGHSLDAIDAFLDSRRGYCEQFAGTFAAMARALGIPSRVAVGFTPGEQDQVDPDVYRVRGQHAHAWPELYIEGSGWVAFEPTPGRGAPGAQNYTGVAEQQDETPVGTEPVEEEAIPPLGPLPEVEEFFPDPGPEAEAPAAAPDPGMSMAAKIVLAVLFGILAIGLLAAAYLVMAPKLAANRRARRWSAAADNRDRSRLAWHEGERNLAMLGYERTRSETPQEFARRAGLKLGREGDLAKLERAIVLAEYAPDEPDDATTDAAAAAAGTLGTLVEQRVPWWDRVKTELDPRELVGSD